jgi:hypothetical protein
MKGAAIAAPFILVYILIIPDGISCADTSHDRRILWLKQLFPVPFALAAVSLPRVRMIEVNDADGAVTLPTIKADSNGASAGQDDPNVNSHLGAVYRFFIGTDATDLDIKTDGTDKFVGSLAVGVNDGTYKVFQPAASNDVISMNGGTQGGDKNSYLEITAIADNEYLVQGVLIGSGTIATPFADS